MPITVYSAYERIQLRQLALLLPDLAAEIDAIIDRVADLLPIVRGPPVFRTRRAYSGGSQPPIPTHSSR
jgi:hypothetical protein